MDRRDVIKRMLYPKCKSAVEFTFDTLIANPLLYYITIQDIAQLNKIATSVKYSSKPKEKYKMIDQILVPRGFKKMASGTNRVVYRFLDDYRIVLKVAIDKVGLSDNGNEYKNQQLLKPFVTKCFEVSPCGTVGLFERVVPITSREEFLNISEDVFDLINNLIGKYVLEDIGEKFYMNYGLREGFGPVLLDYPYVFELDGRKLRCNVQDPLDPKGYCGGEIDYDLGYNNLICTKCGKRYLATELKSNKKSDGGPKIIIEGDDIIMKCVLKRGDQVISTLNSEEPVSTNTIPPRKQYDRMKGQVKRNPNYGSNNRGGYTQSINTRDEVKLEARLKGQRRSKDIDKIARERERRNYENSKKVPVSFDSTSNQSPVTDKPNSDLPAQHSVTYSVATPKTNSVPNNDSSIKSDNELIVTIDPNGYIYDKNHNLVGYALGNGYVKKLERRSKELASYEDCNPKETEITKDNESPTVKNEDNDSNNDEREDHHYSESCTTSIGEVMKKAYPGNENYKTSGVTSPIDPHFHNNSIDTEEEKSEEKVEEKESETDDSIPELIIHPRNDRVIKTEEDKTAIEAELENY